MSVSIPGTSLSMKVLELTTRNRILFCEITIQEFEEMRVIQGVSMEIDLIWVMRQSGKNTVSLTASPVTLGRPLIFPEL